MQASFFSERQIMFLSRIALSRIDLHLGNKPDDNRTDDEIFPTILLAIPAKITGNMTIQDREECYKKGN